MHRLLVLCFAISLLVPQLAAAKSLALIIGNQDYAQITPLQKARADADGYATLLGAQGFAVTLANDLDRTRMLETLAAFYDSIDEGDTVVFVYSGHGWSDGQLNYLLPTDIRGIGSQTVLAGESFVLRNGISGILDQISARKPQLTVAIVDACRDNPFAAEGLTRSVGLGRGLVRMQPPTGTFIAFSAGEGQTALDRLSDEDPSPYSVFTRVFLGELALPQDLQAAFKTTQQRVNAIAQTIGHPQRPAYYDEVVGSACLDPRCRIEADADDDIVAGSVTPVGVGAGRAGAVDPSAVAAREWQDFRDTTSREALEAFARRHEGTVYAILARARIAELEKAAKPAADTPSVAEAKAEPGSASPATETAPEAEAGVTPDDRADSGANIDVAAIADPEPPRLASEGKQPRRPGRSPAGPAAGGVAGLPAAAKRAPWCEFTDDPVEKTVCANPRLLDLGLRVDALMLARHGALDPEGRTALLQSHRVWKLERASCGDNPACIEDFLRARIEALGRGIWRATKTPPARL